MARHDIECWFMAHGVSYIRWNKQYLRQIQECNFLFKKVPILPEGALTQGIMLFSETCMQKYFCVYVMLILNSNS